MSSSRTILPRLAQFGEPGVGPDVALKIKSHQHAAGKLITRGLSRGARKWGESASKLHIGGQDSDVTDAEGAEGLDLALSGIQDKSVRLPVIDDGTFHRQTPTPDIRASKTPIPGVGHWTKRGGKLRPASVLPGGYLSDEDTPNTSKLDLTLTIEGQADPRLLPQRSSIKAWKLINKSPDGGALHPPPTTPDQTQEYEEMFRSIEEVVKQVLLCQSFGITIEKHKSKHGMVAIPIFHCPRCFKHWSMSGMPLQNCDNPNQPTKGPEFHLNKKNHYIFQKFTQLPSKDKEHIIDIIKSPHTSNISLEPDVSTESLLILKDILSEDDDDNANMFLGSMQDLGSTLIARRASIEVKSQNEQRSSQQLTKLKSQRSIHKQQGNIDQKHSDERNMTKHTQATTNTHHVEHRGEKKMKTFTNPAKNMKVSDSHQNEWLGTAYDEWTTQKGGHFTKENKQSYEHDSVRDRMFDGERGKHKPVGKFAFGPDTSNQTSVGLIGPDGGYYIGTYDNDGQFAPLSRLNRDGSTCPMTRGPDDFLYFSQDDRLNTDNKAEKEKSGLFFSFDNHHQHNVTSPDVGLQSEFLDLKEQEQTNLQKFSTLPRDLTWDHDRCSEEIVPSNRGKPGHARGNVTSNYNLNHHKDQEENTHRKKHSSHERNQETLETPTTTDDESVSQERETNIQEKENNFKERQENAHEREENDQEGDKNESTRMENATIKHFHDTTKILSTEQITPNTLDINAKSITVLEEIPPKMAEKDFTGSQHELDNDGIGHKDHLILPHSLIGHVNGHKPTESLNDAISNSALPEHQQESGISNICLESEIPDDCLENKFQPQTSLMLIKPNEVGTDQQLINSATHVSEFSVTVTDKENEIAEEDNVTDINKENFNKERKSSEMEAESISQVETETTRIRKSSIVPHMGSQDILPMGSDSYYDAYASSKLGQKGPSRRNGKAQRRASIDHRGKVKNPAVKNVTGRPDTKAGALKKHMLATPKSLLAQNTSFEINQQKAQASKDFVQLSEMETVDESNLIKSKETEYEQAEMSGDKDIPTQKSLLEGKREPDMTQKESIRMEDSAETLLPESEELSASKQTKKIRRPPKKEKLPAMRERKRVGDQKNVQEEEIKEDTTTEGYPPVGEDDKDHQNELPEIVRTPHDKIDSTPLKRKESLARISTPLNKKESLTRIKSATEGLEKLSLSKFSKFQINLNQSLGLDQPMPESNQASFRMTYSTLPGTFDDRKRSSKSLLREKKQSTEKLPSLPTTKKAPSPIIPDRPGSKMDRDVEYMVIQKAPSKRGRASTPERSSTSNSVGSEEEESIWESVSEMWQKHSKEMRRVSTLEEYSYLPLTKAFTFSFFEIPFQYVEQNKELKIRGDMVKSMKRPPRMKIKGKKKRPPTAELNKLLEEKRNQVKKQNLVYKLWQMERRTTYEQPIPKLGSF